MNINEDLLVLTECKTASMLYNLKQGSNVINVT